MTMRISQGRWYSNDSETIHRPIPQHSTVAPYCFTRQAVGTLMTGHDAGSGRARGARPIGQSEAEDEETASFPLCRPRAVYFAGPASFTAVRERAPIDLLPP